MSDESQVSSPNFGTVANIIDLLEPLSVEDRKHVLRTVATWLRIEVPLAVPHVTVGHQPSPADVAQASDDKFSNREVLSVKDFIFEKNPRTEPERMACLAYYLTHYRDIPHFKTSDLVHLNTEAAQRTFSNPSVASSNAIRDGFFVSAPKAGLKQLSAMGERFVHALPDRESAQQIKQRMSGARRGRKSGGKNDVSETSDSNGQESIN